MKTFKKPFYHLFIPKYLTELKNSYNIGKQFIEWQKMGYGYPVPSQHIVKEKIIEKFQKEYNYDTLVETGTCQGDMIQAQKSHFKEIYSIELDKKLYEIAKNKFKADSHIKILQGDSAYILPDLITKIRKPTIFWLDAHYSGGKTAKGLKNTPILEECAAIISQNIPHLILIDDARSFYKLKDYPTIEQLKKYIQLKNSSYKMKVKDDIIRFYPSL